MPRGAKPLDIPLLVRRPGIHKRRPFKEPSLESSEENSFSPGMYAAYRGIRIAPERHRRVQDTAGRAPPRY